MIKTTVIKEPVFDQQFINNLHVAVEKEDINMFIRTCVFFWKEIEKEGFTFCENTFDFVEPFYVPNKEESLMVAKAFETADGKSNDKGNAMCKELTGYYKNDIALWFNDLDIDTYRVYDEYYRIGFTKESDNNMYPYIKRIQIADLELV